MPNTLKIANVFLLASIATLFINTPTIFLFFKVNDLFLICSLLAFIIVIFKKEITLKQDKKLYYFIIIWVIFNIMGNIISFLIVKNIDITQILKEYGRMVACFLIFIEIVIISKHNNNFPKWALFCFLIPSIIIPLIYIIPQNSMHYIEYINGIYIRFTGLFENPNAYAQFMIIPVVLLLFFILKTQKNDKKIIALKIIGFLIFCLSIGTIVWSGSRGGIIGLIISFIFFIFFLARSDSWKKIIIGIIIIMLSYPVGSFMLPNKAEEHIESRIKVVTLNKSLKINELNIPLVTGSQDRLTIWKNSIPFIIKNPLGYGLSYYNTINITDNYGNNHKVSHNIILQLILTGGILLLLYAGTTVLKLIHLVLIKNKKYFTEIHVLLSIFLGLMASSFFDEFLYVRWLWVIISLLYYYITSIENSEKKIN